LGADSVANAVTDVPLEAALRGDAHLVQVGVGGKLQQVRHAGLPAEAPDALSADALADVAIVGQHRADDVGDAARGDRFAGGHAGEERVGHGVDQAQTKKRRGQAADVADGRLGGLDLERRVAALAVRAGERADREQLAQRSAPVRQRIEQAVDEAAEAPLDAGGGRAADGARVVADGAALGVEDRPQPLVDLFLCLEVRLELGEVLVVGAGAGQAIAEDRRLLHEDVFFRNVRATRRSHHCPRSENNHRSACFGGHVISSLVVGALRSCGGASGALLSLIGRKQTFRVGNKSRDRAGAPLFSVTRAHMETMRSDWRLAQPGAARGPR